MTDPRTTGRSAHRVLLTSTLDDAVDGLLPRRTPPPAPRAPASPPAAAGRPGCLRWAERRALRLALTPFARRFRHEMEAADAAIGRRGLASAGRLLLDAYSGPVTYSGLEHVPVRGPLIVAANHPGTVDTPALMVALATRPDLKILALDRPFLHAVPALAGRLLYVAEDGRGALVRLAAAHLRAGGALLTFPGGTIEPDPALRRPDAVASLATWSRSTELLARLAAGTAIVPAAVSGVLSRHALAAWPVRHRPAADRELAAAVWQVVRRDTTIRPAVTLGEPLRGRPDETTAHLEAAMKDLLSAY